MASNSTGSEWTRFQVSLFAGLAIGVAFGLLNAYLAWQPMDEYAFVAKRLALPDEFRGARAVWNETPIFLASVLIHAAIGILCGAALGWFRNRSGNPASDPRREFARDVLTLFYGVIFLVSAGFIPGYFLRAENPVRGVVAIVIGMIILCGFFRALAWISGYLLRSRPASFVIERLPYKVLGISAATGLVLFSTLPPILTASPRPLPLPSGKAPDGAPNVLLIVMDTARADRFSAYGYEKPTTPEIDGIASEGVLFERVVSPAVYTLPGHASIFTGAPSSVHGANTPVLYLDSSMTTLAEILSRNGYVTAGFSNNHWVQGSSSLTQGFLHYEDHWRFNGFKPLRLVLKTWKQMRIYGRRGSVAGGAAYTLPRVLEWIEKLRDTGGPDGKPRPFFVFVNLMETHYPVSYRPGFTDLFMGPRDTVRDLMRTNQDFFRVIADPSSMSPEDYRRYGVLYDGGLRFADHYIGKFVRELKHRGLLDETLLIITADHGEGIGDHGYLGHRQSVYDELTRVPLILRHPRIQPPGRRDTRWGQTFDIFRTVLDFVGVEEPLPPDAALARNLLQEPPKEPMVVAEEESAEWAVRLSPQLARKIDLSRVRKRYKAIYDGNFKYIWGTEGIRELYNLAVDPGETKNLVAEMPDQAARMAHELERWVRNLPKNRIDGVLNSKLKIDRKTKDSLRSLGYIR